MNKNYRIYLDVCCLNRPFDQQSQARIRLETEAILEIINYCQSGTWTLITSSVLEAEISQTPNQERIKNVKKILLIAKIKVLSGHWLKERASQLQKLGFTSYDAAHIVSAERASSDIFLTTDDRLVRKSETYAQLLKVKVNNPLQWLTQVMLMEKNEDENPE
ncbi:MAG: PIN domain-containing protein [Pleurocapsa sp.]